MMRETITFLTEDGYQTIERQVGIETAGDELSKFIDFVQSIHPELTENQAALVTASLLNELPKVFLLNPTFMEALNDAAIYVTNNRIE